MRSMRFSTLLRRRPLTMTRGSIWDLPPGSLMTGTTTSCSSGVRRMPPGLMLNSITMLPFLSLRNSGCSAVMFSDPFGAAPCP